MIPFDTLVIPPDSPRRITGRHFTQRQFKQLTLPEVYFIQCTFTDISLADVVARNVHFEHCHFTRLSLNGGQVENCTFRFCKFNDISARGLSLLNASCIEVQWQGCYFTDCLIERWLLSQCQLDDAHLQNIQLHYWTVQSTPITRLTMTDSKMQDSNWHGCLIQQSVWKNSQIIRQVMGSCVLKGCQYKAIGSDILVWSECQLEHVDFCHQPLANSNFHKTQLTQCWLSHADLSAALFSEAHIDGCDLSMTQLAAAQFVDATLSDCNLAAANLQKASLLRANLTRCDLTQANFTQADLRGCILNASSLQASKLSRTRLHGAQIPTLDTPLQMPDPLLIQIDNWYGRHQPGPKNNPQFPSVPSGASRYV